VKHIHDVTGSVSGEHWFPWSTCDSRGSPLSGTVIPPWFSETTEPLARSPIRGGLRTGCPDRTEWSVATLLVHWLIAGAVVVGVFFVPAALRGRGK
jgi:hypothetical protein